MSAADFWSLGDYAVIGDLWAQQGQDLIEALDPAGQDVVDLATGTGVTAIAAARAGARVTGVDITPALLQEAERRAQAARVAVTWVQADVEDLPLEPASADLVTSTVGLIFADPARALPQAWRLLRPGAELVMTSWSADGAFGSIRQALAGYFPEAPAPWHETPGSIRATVRECLGEVGVAVQERAFTMVVPSAEDLIALMEEHSAPIIVARSQLGEAWATAREQLLAAISASGERENGSLRLPVNYLVSTISRD
ncbi:class I SAM-dependent methyltransferase [Bogoriella caseilytica]|uniref:Methyltransferase family protein n=1 Tax=Bogoriella caseilytica TaxID=56055 RepID=A0A3N2B9J6_9MICO|nr:class I SAM-dependent methyltransferase [Bogoriella caseilytica]ROR71936.1 methyltransferase family protein [Bogoriella caseilytica]